MVKSDTALSSAPPKVVVLALPETPLLSIAQPMDVFGSAPTMWRNIFPDTTPRRFDVSLVSVDGRPVTTMCGLPVGVHAGIDEIERTDLVVVTAMVRGNETGQMLKSVVPWLRAQHERGSRIASLCTGAFVLAATGLLDGKNATTHWGAARRFASTFPSVRLLPHRLIVDEAPLYTSGGSLGSMDLCFYLVETLLDRETALNWSRVLVKDFRCASQSPFAVFAANRAHGDSDIIGIQDFLEEGYAEPLSITDLARRAGMSTRTFERRFKTATGESPIAYLQKLRIEAAKRMLEMKRDGVDQITIKVGYEDTATFSKLFSRHVGIPPAAYRRKFTAPENGSLLDSTSPSW